MGDPVSFSLDNSHEWHLEEQQAITSPQTAIHYRRPFLSSEMEDCVMIRRCDFKWCVWCIISSINYISHVPKYKYRNAKPKYV